MKKGDLFKGMIDQAKEVGFYVGTGNPEAKILIIGKEAAISKEQGEKLNQEFKSNFEQWKEITDFDQSKIKDCGLLSNT